MGDSLSDTQFLIRQADCFMSVEEVLILEQNCWELQYHSGAIHVGDSGQGIEIVSLLFRYLQNGDENNST